MTKRANKRLIIGLMSGTSVDAIDAALVEVVRKKGRAGGAYEARVLHHTEVAWSDRTREHLLAVMAPAVVGTTEICLLNFEVARQFAGAVEKLIGEAGVKRQDITAIGSHGQTICHIPPSAKLGSKSAGRAKGSTLQLGDVSVIATLTGIPTVGGFRTADMAVGGQGAPLVPWADAMLLSDERVTRCVQNIGGIANVTFLPKVAKGRNAAAMHGVIAFDTGPGNMLMDAVVKMASKGQQSFDENGRLAGKGHVDPQLFRALQAHRYFDRHPPKSTGREDFGEMLARRLLKEHRRVRLPDMVCTLARLTAWSIADAYLQFLPEVPEEVIVCGGGADNPVLMRMLEEELGALKSDIASPAAPTIRRIEAFGIPNKAKEAASFALLAAATLDGIPGNLPSVTGATRPVVLGVVARP